MRLIDRRSDCKCSSSGRMRYAYIKPNNAVRELNRIGLPPTDIPEGGPDAYVGHFLDVANGSPCLIISEHLYPQKNEFLKNDNTLVYSYCIRALKPKIGKRIIDLPLRIWVSLHIYYKLVRFKPDVLLSWSAFLPLWATYLASKTLAIPFVYSRHSRLVESKEEWFKKFIEVLDRFIIRRAAAVIVHGPFLKKQMMEINVSPQRVIEFNWSFKHFFRNGKNPAQKIYPSIWKQKKIILFIGRLEARKGVFDLLTAYQKLFLTSDECVLAYAGSGGAFEELQAKIKSLKLKNDVKLLGRIPHGQIPHLIRDCYIVVTPSRSMFTEGRCMAAMEGLVMGKPVIAPNNGPFPFLIKDYQNGILYQPDSIDSLAQKIKQIVNDKTLYAKVKKGAEETGKILVKAKINFSKAVIAAIQISKAE